MSSAKDLPLGIGGIPPFSGAPTSLASKKTKVLAKERMAGRAVHIRKRERPKIALKALLPKMVGRSWTHDLAGGELKQTALAKTLATEAAAQAKPAQEIEKPLTKRAIKEEKKPADKLSPKDAFELISYFKDVFKNAQETYRAIKATNDIENKGDPLKLAGRLFLYVLSENFGSISKAIDSIAGGLGFVINLDSIAIQFASTTLGTLASKLVKYGIKTVEFLVSGDLNALKENSKAAKNAEIAVFLTTKYGLQIPLYALKLGLTPAKNIMRAGINLLLSATVRQKVKDGLHYLKERTLGKQEAIKSQDKITDETIQEVMKDLPKPPRSQGLRLDESDEIIMDIGDGTVKLMETKPMSFSQLEELQESISKTDSAAIEKNLQDIFSKVTDTDKKGNKVSGKDILTGLRAISNGPLELAGNAFLYLKAKQFPDLEKGVETIASGSALVIGATKTPVINNISNVFGTLVKYGVVGISYAVAGKAHTHVGEKAGDVAALILKHGMRFILFSAKHESISEDTREIPIIARMKASLKNLIQQGLDKLGFYQDEIALKKIETQKKPEAAKKPVAPLLIVTAEQLQQARRDLAQE